MLSCLLAGCGGPALNGPVLRPASTLQAQSAAGVEQSFRIWLVQNFLKWDANHDLALSQEEAPLGMPVSPEAWTTFLQQCDGNRDGKVTQEEMMSAKAFRRNMADFRKFCRDAFTAMDRSEDRLLQRSEFANVAAADRNLDGMVNLSEYEDYMALLLVINGSVGVMTPEEPPIDEPVING
jgi:hypothetical protein